MVIFRCNFVTFTASVSHTLERLYMLLNVIERLFNARNLPGCWTFTLFVSISRLRLTLTVQCSERNSNRFRRVTTYLIQIIDTMTQRITKGTPCKEINSAIISKHFRK